MSAKRLPLDVIQVAEPCHESWERMTGDDRVRFCQGCNKHVHNLSAMNRTDAERLVCESAGSLCVRFARAQDGQIQTLEYQPARGRRRGWRFWTAAGTAVAALVAGINGYVLARGRPAPPPPVMGAIAVQPVMGKVAAPNPTPPCTQPAE